MSALRERHDEMKTLKQLCKGKQNRKGEKYFLLFYRLDIKHIHYIHTYIHNTYTKDIQTQNNICAQKKTNKYKKKEGKEHRYLC